MTKTNETLSFAYDGVAYSLGAKKNAQWSLGIMFKALDPFQNAENAWRRALTRTATAY
jgi:hypothetical protein